MAKTDKEPFTVPVSTKDVDRPRAGRWIRVGAVAVIGFVGALLMWGTLAPIESAAVAVGSVSLESNKKLVQHLEGGIVAEVLVKEGQTVAKDEIVIRLDTTQAQARIVQLKAKIAGLERQLKLVESELETVEQLLKRGHSTRPRLLALQRKKAEHEGEIGEARAQLGVAEDAVTRAAIRAPVAGTVIDLKIHTRGGVIKAGETLMAIVPKDEPLYIETRIDPNDIDVVRPGLAAHVRLTPYSARFVAPIPGKVTQVSADRMTDQRTNATYYVERGQTPFSLFLSMY